MLQTLTPRPPGSPWKAMMRDPRTVPALAKPSTTKEASIHSWLTMACAAMDDVPSRAATAAARKNVTWRAFQSSVKPRVKPSVCLVIVLAVIKSYRV